MNNNCRKCNSEKRYDEFRELYKPCDSCNTRRVLRYYYDNRDEILEKKKKNYYYNNNEYLNEYTKRRKSKLSDLENQIKTLIEMIKTTVSVC